MNVLHYLDQILLWIIKMKYTLLPKKRATSIHKILQIIRGINSYDLEDMSSTKKLFFETYENTYS
jgi:hypothetical protein